jgi:hypothetical protein
MKSVLLASREQLRSANVRVTPKAAIANTIGN